MAYGLQIYNDSGAVQIDQDYSNLTFVSKWTVNSMTASAFYTFAGFEIGGAETDIVYFVVDYPTTQAVIVVKPPTGRDIAPVPLTNEANSVNPPPSGYKRAIFCSTGSTATSITAYRFDTPSISGLSGSYGLAIRNSAGVLVYDSNRPVLRPKYLATLRGSTVGTTYALDGSRSYGFLFSNPTQGVYYPASGSTRKPKNAGFVLNSSTQAAVAAVNHYAAFSPLGAGALIDNHPSVGMIVDVTGM